MHSPFGGESRVVAPPLKIGAVARHSGLSVKTIRFYCDDGLIQPISRSDGGYRLFDAAVFAELSLIRTLRAMELPLQDVRQVLESRRSGVCTCSALQATIRGKAGEISARIEALQSLRAELLAMLDSWEACGGRPPASAPSPGSPPLPEAGIVPSPTLPEAGVVPPPPQPLVAAGC